MSEVNAADLTEINNADDVFGLYAGSGDDAKAGIEVELAFFNPDQADIPAMSLCQNRILKNSAMAKLPDDDWVHNEPTSELLEVASKAAHFADAKSVLDDTNKKMEILTNKAAALGLKRSYFQELPERTADDLLSRIVELDRYKVMYAPYREDMKKCVQYFAVCKSNQVSISPYNMDHMLDNIRRLYILSPFLFLLTDNSVGFVEGKPFSGHAGMHLRHEGLLEGRGGVLPYVFSAQSGEELIASHIDHVLNNPLFMHYDREGNLVKVPSGDWSVTFNTLKERGLNIASNYYLSQSLLWPDVKIAALKDAGGSVYGHRYEARMFGVGVHQHQTAFIITTALAFHEGFAKAVDELLELYGFSADSLQETYALVLESYQHARAHNGKFFDIAYGTATMASFAKDFADILENVIYEIGLEDEAQALLGICRTGCTDAKVNRCLFPTLKDVINQQRSFDPAIFNDPNKSARDIYMKEIARVSGSRCAAA
tara:strand:- start:17126 stop:18580 length:1455 start_codon:yes stop_codon:yes gene_type:complete